MDEKLEAALATVKTTRSAYVAVLDKIEELATQEGIDAEQRAVLILVTLSTKMEKIIQNYAEAVLDLAAVAP